jgi:hypothetical protein
MRLLLSRVNTAEYHFLPDTSRVLSYQLFVLTDTSHMQVVGVHNSGLSYARLLSYGPVPSGDSCKRVDGIKISTKRDAFFSRSTKRKAPRQTYLHLAFLVLCCSSVWGVRWDSVLWYPMLDTEEIAGISECQGLWLHYQRTLKNCARFQHRHIQKYFWPQHQVIPLAVSWLLFTKQLQLKPYPTVS